MSNANLPCCSISIDDNVEEEEKCRFVLLIIFFAINK